MSGASKLEVKAPCQACGKKIDGAPVAVLTLYPEQEQQGCLYYAFHLECIQKIMMDAGVGD